MGIQSFFLTNPMNKCNLHVPQALPNGPERNPKKSVKQKNSNLSGEWRPPNLSCKTSNSKD